MSKTASPDLYNLIKSLTTSEKRQFKLYAERQSGGKQNMYAKLFDTIDQQEEFDDVKLLKSYPSLKQRNFLSMKSYLYEMVLKSLWSSSPDHTTSAKIAYYIGAARLLIKKKLYQQAIRTLGKAKKVATGYKDHVKGFEILSIEATLKVRIPEMNTLKQHHENHYQRMRLLEKTRVETEYYNLYMEIYYLMIDVDRVHPDNQEVLKRLDEIMSSPLMKKKKEDLSLRAESLYYEIHIKNCRLRGNKVGLHAYAYKYLLFFEENDAWRQVDATYEYIWTCQTYLAGAMSFGQFEEHRIWLEKLKQLKIDCEFETEREFCVYDAEFNYLVGTCQFQDARKKSVEIESLIDKDGTAIETNMHFMSFFQFAFLNIAIGDYQKSLYWLSRILNHTNVSNFSSYEQAAKLLVLINYFELGEDRILRNAIRNFYRYLKKKDRLYSFDILLLKFLRRLSGIIDRENFAPLFAELREEMQEIEQENASHLAHMHIWLWLASKATEKTVSELLRAEQRGESISDQILTSGRSK